MLAMTVLLTAAPAAMAETRTLKLYFLHTGERAEITYKRNGRYIKSGLDEINRFLRDWRQNESTDMNPHLLDLLWEVYRASGSNDYINVISAYRSPKTNAMLRSRSSGVAKKSQHMLGNAMDFFLPDVKLAKLRNIGLKMQMGGVGYYPRSGSPFVHLDVAGVRHWPRMSRKELVSVFPNGKTLHVPSDGKPLPGYQQALASYEARKRNGGSIQIAEGNDNRGRGLLAALFGGGADEEEDNAQTQVAAAQPAQQQPARPQQQIQPQAETPATILASLPARAVPVPREAPRPDVMVGSSLSVASAPDTAPAAGQEATQDVAAMLAALDVPRPTERPDYTPPQPAVQVAAAGSQDGSALPTATAFVTPTRRPEPPHSPDVIAELLAAQKGDALQADADSTVPAAAPGAEAPEYMVAALPSPKPSGRPAETSRRLALLKANGGASPTAVISGSAKTTQKGPRPGPADARDEAEPMVLPVGATVAELALSPQSVLTEAQHTERPTFSPQIAKAPKVVYTKGFQTGIVVADARRFTGDAVTFLSVAKFD